MLYTGMRTKNCRKLKEAACIRVTPIEIGDHYILFLGKHPNYALSLPPNMADEFAVKDGFNDRHEMIAFFEEHYKLPFLGELIEW